MLAAYSCGYSPGFGVTYAVPGSLLPPAWGHHLRLLYCEDERDCKISKRKALLDTICAVHRSLEVNGFCMRPRSSRVPDEAPAEAGVSRDKKRLSRLNQRCLGLGLDLIQRDVRRQFDHFQATICHLHHTQIGDDEINHTLAGERQGAFF